MPCDDHVGRPFPPGRSPSIRCLGRPRGRPQHVDTSPKRSLWVGIRPTAIRGLTRTAIPSAILGSPSSRYDTRVVGRQDASTRIGRTCPRALSRSAVDCGLAVPPRAEGTGCAASIKGAYGKVPALGDLTGANEGLASSSIACLRQRRRRTGRPRCANSDHSLADNTLALLELPMFAAVRSRSGYRPGPGSFRHSNRKTGIFFGKAL